MDKQTGIGIHFAMLPESAVEQYVKFMRKQRSKKKPLSFGTRGTTMRDYEELVNSLKNCVYIPCNKAQKEKCLAGKEYDCKRELMAIAANAIEELQKCLSHIEDAHNEGYDVGYWAGRRDYEPKWIGVEEPPDNDRNIFICHGSTDFKAPCVGHYDPGMKMFYEDKNWFASPIYDVMFWCEMPKLPLPEPPEEDDNG